MARTLDHLVLWVEDPLRSLEFYQRVLGLEGVRVTEFREGKAPFPSVRVSEESILDLMARTFAPAVSGMAGSEGSAGNLVNHVCLAMDAQELEALRERLEKAGVSTSAVMENSFGARGNAPRAFYFRDPDGNVLEARTYA